MNIISIKIVLLSEIRELAEIHGVKKIHDDAIDELSDTVTWGGANRTLINCDTYICAFETALSLIDADKYSLDSKSLMNELRNSFKFVDYIDLEN